MNIRPVANVLDMFHGDNREKIPDFAALKAAGIFAIWHKASQGLHYVDPKYQERRKAAQDAGLLFGAYHFQDATDPDNQADKFLEASGVSSSAPQIALANDFEDGGHAALHQCVAIMGNIDRNSPPGIHSVLYSGNRIRETLKAPVGGHVAQDMLGAAQFFAMHRLWLAEYGPHENIPWPWNVPNGNGKDVNAPMTAPGIWLWQFSEKGRVNPVVGNVDVNFYNGTAEQLAANWLA